MLKFELSREMVIVIGKALGAQPYDLVVNVIHELQKQVNAQEAASLADNVTQLKPEKSQGMNNAEYFGVVLLSGKVSRVINPDQDYELAIHHLDQLENMLILRKSDFDISSVPNSMTLDQVAHITELLDQGG